MTDQNTAADTVAAQESVAPVTETTEKPAEASTEAASEESATSQTDTDTESADETKPKKQGGFQKKIDQLTREKYLLKAKLEQIEQAKAAQPQQQQTQTVEEPKLESFNTVDEFVTAHRDWAKNEGFKSATEEVKKQFEQQNEAERRKAVQAQMDTREALSRAKYKDYGEIVEPFAPILMGNPVIAEYIASEEMGMEVAYHLAKSPAILEELSGLSSFAAGRKLLEMEARLKAPPPPKPVTNAPDPIKPVGSAAVAEKSPEDMPMEEYVKWRRTGKR